MSRARAPHGPHAKLPSPETHGWWRNQVTLGNMINLGVVAFACAGFYFTTTASLASLGDRIKGLETQLAGQALNITNVERNERGEREKARDDMVRRAEQTAGGIAELNKQTAVLGTQLQAIKDELVKIGTKLDTVTTKRN